MSSQNRLLPKPPNFDSLENERNQAAKLQRLMSQSKRKNPELLSQQNKERCQKYRHTIKNRQLDHDILARDFSIDISNWYFVF